MKRNNSSVQIEKVLSNKAMVNDSFGDIPDLEVQSSSHDEHDIFSDEDEWGLPIDQIDT